MDVMLQKCDSFYSSADLLMSRNLFCPSAHLAFYSVFILIKYVVCNFLGVSYEEQDDNNGKMSHQSIIDQVMDDIDRRDPNIWLDVERRLSSMKHLRAKADYKEETISKAALTVHLAYAQDFCNYVKPLYGI